MTTLPEDFNEERINAPRGYWKDGLFDCFSLGILHSSVICAFCCTQSKYTLFLHLGITKLYHYKFFTVKYCFPHTYI